MAGNAPRLEIPAGPSARPTSPIRPQPTALQGEHDGRSTSTLRAPVDPAAAPPAIQPRKKRAHHRGGKKKRNRRQSFAAPSDDGTGVAEELQSREDIEAHNAARASFYRVKGRNHSNTSIESEALLDHREQQSTRPRRQSTMGPVVNFGQTVYSTPTTYRSSLNPLAPDENRGGRPRTGRSGGDSHEDEEDSDEGAPLMGSSHRSNRSGGVLNYGSRKEGSPLTPGFLRRRNSSKSSKSSSNKKRTIFERQSSNLYPNTDYNVNYPPSVPGSPELGASHSHSAMNFGDMLARDDYGDDESPGHEIERDPLSDAGQRDGNRDQSPRRNTAFDQRRHTIAQIAEEDVCFPVDTGMSEIGGDEGGDDDMPNREGGEYRRSNQGPRRRRGRWPDLAMLEEWSRIEKEGRSEERRAKSITEPQLIGGRLRPVNRNWHRAEDDAPYRFTYFNEEFQSTIHSQTISELVQPGSSFRELFIPDPPVLSDSSESEDEGDDEPAYIHHVPGQSGESRAPTRNGSVIDPYQRPESRREGSIKGSIAGSKKESDSRERSKESSPPPASQKDKAPEPGGEKPEKPKRYGDRPTWWLDILSPTEAEMKVLAKTFGIHPLTAEDIILQEAREKVELFRNYYFVNYRSFEQDMNSEDFLEPVNMYVVVFREGVLSFHFSMTPHPANVRRRIRQLKDYMILSSDWISYAIIDDITDVFAPLIQSIEDEVDDIDDAILRLHSIDHPDSDDGRSLNEKKSEGGDGTSGDKGGDMLRRVGDCRKKVMGLYRLLGNKADVIKGFAKRCNEHWEVAPRSEIGLYLGDIQDHIVTMTSNLSHYEKILARSHGNYLAQINIRMNERQEQTADVLGKLTVLGTIVLPMNIITGLWGMNVWVPGQGDTENLTWFFCITGSLLFFGLACFAVAKKMYGIV